MTEHIAVQENVPLHEADDYLHTGLMDCRCPAYTVFPGSKMARCNDCSATGWVSNFDRDGCHICGAPTKFRVKA